MQTISSILKIERGIGTWVTDTGAADYAPSFPLGVLATLSLDLRGPLKAEAFAPSLPAYPIQELQGLSLLMVMDLDYDQETPPRFIRTSGITISEDEQGHLLCTIPLPDTNTEAMREALSTAETRAFQCELIGRNAEGQDAFAVQFSLTVMNRVLLGEATEAPDTDSPEWLPTVTAIVQEVVAQNAGSLKGEKGESAYSTWLSQGNSGTEEDFLASLKGEGQKGDKGDTGSLAMGTVSTLPPGEDATASIQDGLLHLGIPKGEKGKDGTALCYAFSPESAPDSSAWHQHCQKTDRYWRISEDAGATWSHAMPLSQAPVSPIARFSPVAQETDAQWKTPEDMGDYAQLHDGAAYFRVKMKGYPWTEPRLISATSGMESMTQEQIQEAEEVLKATTIRASFSSDNASWHASIQEGDLYLRFFSTTGTVLAIWNLSDFGSDHSLQELQAASQGAPWHEYPKDGDRYMKISLDGGATWFSKCFQIEGSPGEANSLTIGSVSTLPAGSQATASITGEAPNQVLNLGIPKGKDGTGSSSSYTLPPATSDTLGGVKVGSGLSVAEDGTISANGTGSSGDVDLSSYATKEELSTGLSGKANASHTHAKGDISGLPATLSSLTDHAADASLHLPSSGGTSGQVLTKTDTGAQWADAPASSGSSGEASTDAGAVRYVSTLEDYDAICAMASSTSSGGVVPFIALDDIPLSSASVLSPGLNAVSSSLKRGHTYLRINAEFTIPFLSFKDATVRRIEQRTYYIEKFWIVNPSGSQIDNWALRAWRGGRNLLAGNAVASEAGNEYGYGWTDRTECRDALQWYRNGLWPTVQTDPNLEVSELLSILEKDDTYLGTNPDDLTSVGTNGATLKRINGVWRKGNISRDSDMNLVESFDMDTAYTIQFMYQTSSGSLDTSLQVMKTVTIEETWSSPVFWETVPEEIRGHMELTGDITPGLPRKAEEVEYSSSMEIRPGDCLSVVLSGNVTLSAMGGVDGARQSASIDICPGSHALTAGENLSLVDSLVPEKLNHCEVRWWGAKATLHVLFTEDAPSGGSGGSGEEGGGSGESGGETGGDTPSDGWPAKIVVSNVSSSFDADVSAYAGTYTRTGETLTVLGETIPIWSNGTKYFYGVSTSMGFDLEEPAIALFDQKGSNDAYMSYAYRMKSDASTAWTMGDSANACGMSATITEE